MQKVKSQQPEYLNHIFITFTNLSHACKAHFGKVCTKHQPGQIVKSKRSLRYLKQTDLHVQSIDIHALSKPLLFCLWPLIKAVSTEERKKVGQRSHKPFELNWALGRGSVFPSNTDKYFLRLAGGQLLC